MNDELTFDHQIITRTGDYENITTHLHSTVEEAVALSRHLQTLVHGGPGISDIDFNAALDAFLAGEPVEGGVETWLKMNADQQAIFQAVKKSKKRLAYKKNKEN